jgi:hypothetical protein
MEASHAFSNSFKDRSTLVFFPGLAVVGAASFLEAEEAAGVFLSLDVGLVDVLVFLTLVGGTDQSMAGGDGFAAGVASGAASGVASVVAGAFSSGDNRDGRVDASCANAEAPQANTMVAKSKVINFI